MASLEALRARRKELKNKIGNLKDAKKDFKAEHRDIKGCKKSDDKTLNNVDYWKGQTFKTFGKHADALTREEKEYVDFLDEAISTVDAEIDSLNSKLDKVETKISAKGRQERKGE